MKITKYTIPAGSDIPKTKLAVVADLHNRPCGAVLNALEAEEPDIILVPGDLMSALDRDDDKNANFIGLTFLEKALDIATVFYSLGNHERCASEENRFQIAKTGAVLLDNGYLQFGEFCLGGLSSGFGTTRQRNTAVTPEPDTRWLKEFSAQEGYKILMCHHPEYYPRYIRDLPIDLTVSGHAHGGQWRIFGHSVFAPGQGLFPKYVSGVYEDRLVVSRGLANTVAVPRFGNPTELVFVELVPSGEKN